MLLIGLAEAEAALLADLLAFVVLFGAVALRRLVARLVRLLAECDVLVPAIAGVFRCEGLDRREVTLRTNRLHRAERNVARSNHDLRHRYARMLDGSIDPADQVACQLVHGDAALVDLGVEPSRSPNVVLATAHVDAIGSSFFAVRQIGAALAFVLVRQRPRQLLLVADGRVRARNEAEGFTGGGPVS